MSLTRFAKLALLQRVTIKHNPKTNELIVPIDAGTVWGDGFQSVSEHHEVLMDIMENSGVQISEHRHSEMRFKKGKE